MSKLLTALMCALVLTGFGALAAAEPSPAVAPAPVAQPLLEPAAFMSQVACAATLSNSLMPAPLQKAGCAGGEGGPCDTSTQCKGYVCHIGEVRHCFGSTGSGCNGWCGCW